MENLRNTAHRWLRRSENFFETDMIYLATGGFWLLVGQIFQILTGLILSIAFANLLPKESFGAYQFILSMAAMVGLVSLTGMSTAITQAVARGLEGALRYGFKTHLKWSTGMVLVSWLLSVYYYLHDNPTLSVAFLVVGALSPLLMASGLYKPYLIGKQLFKESTVLDIFQRAIHFFTILIAVLVTDNPLVVITAYFISYTLSSFLSYLWVIKKYHLPLNSDEELVSYSKHISLIRSFSRVPEYLDKILIWNFLGAAPVAIYTIAQLPYTQIQNILGLINSLIFPKITQKTLEEVRSVLPRKIKIFFFAVLIIVVAYIISAPLLFSWFFPEYQESVIYSQVLMLATLIAPRALINQTFAAHKMKKELYINNASSSTIRLILLAILLPIYGIWGVVIAVLATEAYSTILQGYLFYRSS